MAPARVHRDPSSRASAPRRADRPCARRQRSPRRRTLGHRLPDRLPQAPGAVLEAGGGACRLGPLGGGPRNRPGRIGPLVALMRGPAVAFGSILAGAALLVWPALL